MYQGEWNTLGSPAAKNSWRLRPLGFGLFHSLSHSTLYTPVPDVGRPGWKSYYPLTFLMSLVWITAFSYCLVWWATMVCTATGISQVWLEQTATLYLTANRLKP